MTTSRPAFLRLGRTAGTRATRRSPGKISRGTPTSMKNPPPDRINSPRRTNSPRRHGEHGVFSVFVHSSPCPASLRGEDSRANPQAKNGELCILTAKWQISTERWSGRRNRIQNENPEPVGGSGFLVIAEAV